jgi:hypothetical protein
MKSRAVTAQLCQLLREGLLVLLGHQERAVVGGIFRA